MFRKSRAAIQAWSPELVNGCANRQLAILNNAADLVRPGGYILYSTCTFSLEENELVLGSFLDSSGRKGKLFEVVEIPYHEGFSRGLAENLGFSDDLHSQISHAVRLWPHRQGAEGHFLALIQRVNGSDDGNVGKQQRFLTEEARLLVRQFCGDFLQLDLSEARIHLSGNYVYLLPESTPDITGLKVIHPGWWLGQIKTKRFEPSHALALGLKPDHFKNLEIFPFDHQAIGDYLQGELIRKPGSDGWTGVSFKVNQASNFILGWGKRSQDQIKNYYPRGLRWR